MFVRICSTRVDRYCHFLYGVQVKTLEGRGELGAGDPEWSGGLERMAGEGVEAEIQAIGQAPVHVLSGLSVVSVSHVTN